MTKSTDAEPTATATVRAGRSLIAPDGDKTRVVGHVATPEGGFAPVHAAVTRVLEPGDLFTGPAGEVDRLRGLGYLE